MAIESLLVFLLVIISIFLIGIILIQSGQGDMGTAMGGNAMNQAFGGQGADKLLVRITTGLAAIFMILAISLQFTGKEELDPSVETRLEKSKEDPDKEEQDFKEKNIEEE